MLCVLQGWTPLHSAVSSGREKVVATLLELGAEVDAANSGGQTPLHYAVSSSFSDHNLMKAACMSVPHMPGDPCWQHQ